MVPHNLLRRQTKRSSNDREIILGENMTKNTEKQLPQVILQDTERDATSGMILRDRYVSIQANEPVDKLLKRAKETPREMKNKEER